jgi:hypothetical protein
VKRLKIVEEIRKKSTAADIPIKIIAIDGRGGAGKSWPINWL